MASRDKQIRKAMEEAGWTLARESKHRIWRCPCGEHPQVVVATSAGRGRSAANMAAFVGSKARFGDCAVKIKKG